MGWQPSVAARTQQNNHATIAERRHMRKYAIPEHAYTGYVRRARFRSSYASSYVPKESHEPESPRPVVGKIKNAIVGYKGHRHNKEDMIGTTFTHGLHLVHQPLPSKKPMVHNKTKDHSMSASGYGGFDDLSGYDQFLAAPRSRANSSCNGVAGKSGYGEFKNDSGYGQFAAPPGQSGYGVFEKASGYGQFGAPPPVSGYGEFAKASGYGQFVQPPQSGYGEFAKASGYGQFVPPPQSGYGEFAKASGYGQFVPPPQSGYGEFAKASGYGQFAPPPAESGYGEFAKASGYGQFAPPPNSGYGNFEKASGYGQFAAPPANSGYGAFENASGYGQFQPNPVQSVCGSIRHSVHDTSAHKHEKSTELRATNYISRSNQEDHDASMPLVQTKEIQFNILCKNENLRDRYIRTIQSIGGASQIDILFQRLAKTIQQRKGSKTQLKQYVKTVFDSVAHAKQLSIKDLEQSFIKLAFIATEDETIAFFSSLDLSCSGRILKKNFLGRLYHELD